MLKPRIHQHINVMSKSVSGFSKFSKQQKIKWLSENFFAVPEAAAHDLATWQHSDSEVQRVLDGFTENAIANFPLPLSVAPNFSINGKTYAVPMVIEESSVVAAASSAAKFWAERGGFHAVVVNTVKLGQVHFRWAGSPDRLQQLFPAIKAHLLSECTDLTANMEQRGGGVRSIELLDFTDIEPRYYQLRAAFDTCDSMGANFINSVLERFGDSLEQFLTEHTELTDEERDVEIVMAILSNYTPQCLVRAWGETPIASFTDLARSQGDIVLLSGDLRHVASAVALCRRTMRIVRQNLTWAFAYNFLAIPLAMIGWVTPWMAGIGMSASSLLVVLNALRLRRGSLNEPR